MKPAIFIILFAAALKLSAQPQARIETSDIRNFWVAFDQLSTASSRQDSIKIIQERYIDYATRDFRAFLKVRKFTAEEYVKVIGRFPLFWKSVRPLTVGIDERKEEIQNVLNRLSKELPDFKMPDVCFAIGCMRTGGTTSQDLILIGSEIAASNQTVDKSELKGWLKSVIGNTGDLVSMVAHEAVHTQQFGNGKQDVLNKCIGEGSCDFITVKLLRLSINPIPYQYGETHQCELYQEFRKNMIEKPNDYSSFLYNGGNSKSRPADLGYYIGYKITEGYYNNTEDKKAALKTMLNRGKFTWMFEKSGFEKDCN